MLKCFLITENTYLYMVCSGSRTQTLECCIENHWFRILTFALWDLGWTSRKKNTCALLASAARGHWELKNDCNYNKEGDCSNFLAREKAIFLFIWRAIIQPENWAILQDHPPPQKCARRSLKQKVYIKSSQLQCILQTLCSLWALFDEYSAPLLPFSASGSLYKLDLVLHLLS